MLALRLPRTLLDETPAPSGAVGPWHTELPPGQAVLVDQATHRHPVVLEPLVVEPAHEGGVLDRGRAAVRPPRARVMDLTHRRGSGATRDDAVPVARDDRPAQMPRKGALGAADVEHLRVRTEHDAGDLTIRRDPAQHRVEDRDRAVLPLGRR